LKSFLGFFYIIDSDKQWIEHAVAHIHQEQMKFIILRLSAFCDALIKDINVDISRFISP
jgi:hypothetical protein